MIKARFLKNWALFLVALLFSLGTLAKEAAQLGIIAAADLPLEARQTLVLIKKGGPFPYAQDGRVFGNYEGNLPKRRRGYYHEFTVKTPGAPNRGARRIISGGESALSGEYYYTSDHYATFKRIKE